MELIITDICMQRCMQHIPFPFGSKFTECLIQVIVNQSLESNWFPICKFRFQIMIIIDDTAISFMQLQRSLKIPQNVIRIFASFTKPFE